MRVLYEIDQGRIRERTYLDSEWFGLTEQERVDALAEHAEANATLDAVRNRAGW